MPWNPDYYLPLISRVQAACDTETNNLTNKDIFSLCDPDGVRTHSAGSAECSSAGVILIRSRQNLWSGDSWRDTFYPPVLPRLVDGGAWQLVWSGAVTPHASTDNLLLELERLLARYLSRGQPPPRSRASPSASPWSRCSCPTSRGRSSRSCSLSTFSAQCSPCSPGQTIMSVSELNSKGRVQKKIWKFP